MRLRSIGLAFFAASLMASGAAYAIPTTTIDGVTIPVGISGGGYYIDTETSFENTVTAVGQSFSGIFKVQAIGHLGTNTYSYGDSGVYLTGVFEGFVATSVVAPTATTAGQITFTGGTIKYYVGTSDTFTAESGSIATDFASAETSTLWLQADASVIDASGDTLIITIPGGANTLTSFVNAGAYALGDVVGGDAAAYFDTNTFANPYEPGGLADVAFQGSATSGAAGDFEISGSNNLKANIQGIPEPLTLSLFGAGLAGVAAFGASRRKKA